MNVRKRQVLVIAQQLFAKNGFAATSVQDILNESGISKGTFYNYFATKNECLMAILDQAQKETAVRRKELLIGKDISDKKIFVEQISVRILFNREQNLAPIFEAIFHAKDPDLRVFIKKQLLAELAWLARRLMDVYGEAARPYVSDCAVLLLGMIQHMNRIGACIKTPQASTDILDVVHFVLRRIDAMIADMIDSKDSLLDEELFFQEYHVNEPINTKQMVHKLTAFNHSLQKDYKKGKQYVQFLIAELSTEQPRIFLLESVIRSLSEAFIGTAEERKVRELSHHLWSYMESHDK